MQVELEPTNPDGPARGGGLPLAAPQKQTAVVSGNLAWNVATGAGEPGHFELLRRASAAEA
jgi:hypothetical protein